MDIIRMIIDRDCHVSLSNRQVIKHVISRLKKGYSTYKVLSRKDRRKLMLSCIQYHSDNKLLYFEITHHGI